MSNDPFLIGKVDANKGAASAGPVQPLARAGEAGAAERAAGLSAPAPSAIADQVNISPDVGETDSGSSLPNLAAWNPVGTPPSTGFNISQGPSPGMQAGGVFGPAGISGPEPGMQAGGVYTPRTH